MAPALPTGRTSICTGPGPRSPGRAIRLVMKLCPAWTSQRQPPSALLNYQTPYGGLRHEPTNSKGWGCSSPRIRHRHLGADMAQDDGSIPPDIPSDGQTDPSAAEWAACYKDEMLYVQRYLMHTFNLSNIDASCDAAHEAFEELFKKWPEVVNPRAWLRKVAFRKMLGHLPKNETSLDGLFYDPSDEAASARLMLNEEQRAARAAISQLPITQRRVFSMCFDGFSYSEIAEVLEITEAAARKSMERARAKLRELLT